MTIVVIVRNPKGDIISFEAKGHASGLGAGRDIYCAAISAIIQTAVIGLEQYAGIETALECRDGYLYCGLPETAWEDISAKIITQTMLLGLKAFDEENKGYLKIVEEVR